METGYRKHQNIDIDILLSQSAVPGVMATPLPLTTGLSSSSSSGGSRLARCSMLLTDWFLFLLPWELGRAPGSRASLTFRGGAAGDGSAGGFGVP